MTHKREFLHLFEVIPSPVEVFQDLREDPRWKYPLLFYITTSALLGVCAVPALLAPMRRVFESSFGPGGAEAALGAAKLYIGANEVFVKPLKGLIGWVFLGSSLSIAATISEPKREGVFRKFFSVIAYSETILVFMRIVTLLIVYARGFDSIESESDLIVFKGLEYVLQSPNIPPWALAVVSSIHPFSVWYILVLSTGIGVCCSLRWRTALIVVTLSWVLWSIADYLLGVAVAGLF